MNEVRALRNDYLIYADGEQPHEILASEQFENNIYYVGVYPAYGSSSEEYTYVLYKCQTSFTSCERLPFHYADTGGSFELEFNDSTHEVEVYQWKYKIGDTLIFSLGAEPQCYVERCTIPSE